MEKNNQKKTQKVKSNKILTREQIQKRNQRIYAMQDARVLVIKELYKPKHPQIYKFVLEDVVQPQIISALQHGSEAALLSVLKQETQTGIYSFDLFNNKFCNLLIEEIENFERSGLPVSRPNSMNNYGVILDEIGFTPFLNELRKRVVAPFASLLYSKYNYRELDHHHGFIVQYKLTEDLDLGFHYDESEVTLNVCLGKIFKGGTLYFCGLLNDPTSHKELYEFTHTPGKAILHIGKHRHGANAIKSGERYNLILWCRSTQERNRLASLAGCTCGHSHDTVENESGSDSDNDHHEHEHEHEHEHKHHNNKV